jgi:hypothetical protein
MAEPRFGHRQVLDVRAAIFAGVLASIAFLGTMMFLDAKFLNTPWFTARMMASLVSGGAALDAPINFHAQYVPIGIVVNFAVGILVALIIAYIVHPFGLIVGIIGGALLGFCFYVINYYAVANWFNLSTIQPFKHWTLECGHVVFGAVAGGVYEWLERARYTRR